MITYPKVRRIQHHHVDYAIEAFERQHIRLTWDEQKKFMLVRGSYDRPHVVHLYYTLWYMWFDVKEPYR